MSSKKPHHTARSHKKSQEKPAVSLCPTFQASLDSFKGYFVIIITVFKTDVKEEKKKPKLINLSGSIISVVGKTTVGIIELFECTQKVP
ncbi:hypothetical protein QK903_04590 [Streptococcus thermophilus]|uniref:hypothetical protein n=1 Tax=Streptococcus thermophilus TaxID=1308 RepID=UPI003A80738E